MLKRFVNGLVFGAGFGVAFTAAWIIIMYYVLPIMLTKQINLSGHDTKNSNIVAQAPPIRDASRFLGSSGIYSGDFVHNNTSILASGDGVITGTATINKEPLSGLRLRLALNDKVLTQWTETNPQGIYHIGVPYGDYKIDGYELDVSTANRVLPGKITHPRNVHSSSKFSVSEIQEGRGLKLHFVDPVVKDLGKTKYSVSEDVVLKWKPYPEANQYTVQVYEKDDADSWRRTPLFEWSSRPNLFETYLELSRQDIQLKPRHYYTFEVEATNEAMETLSSTHTDYQGFDFEVDE